MKTKKKVNLYKNNNIWMYLVRYEIFLVLSFFDGVLLSWKSLYGLFCCLSPKYTFYKHCQFSLCTFSFVVSKFIKSVRMLKEKTKRICMNVFLYLFLYGMHFHMIMAIISLSRYYYCCFWCWFVFTVLFICVFVWVCE